MVSCIVIIVDSPTTSTCELVALWLAWLVQGNESPKIDFCDWCPALVERQILRPWKICYNA